MSARNRQVVYDETLAMEMSAAALDLERLRRGFAELFDRAAQAVQLAGYEQDDAVFERYLIVRTADGAEISIAAEWLADRERLVRHIAEGLDRSHGATKPRSHEEKRGNAEKSKRRDGEAPKSALGAPLSGVSIIGVHVEAVVE